MTNNFEWAEGYKRRFGLVHVDFATQQRCLKHSDTHFTRPDSFVPFARGASGRR